MLLRSRSFVLMTDWLVSSSVVDKNIISGDQNQGTAIFFNAGTLVEGF